MAWSLHGRNDHRHWSLTRNICNRCAENIKILFEASLQACSAILTTVRRPGFKPDFHMSKMIPDWSPTCPRSKCWDDLWLVDDLSYEKNDSRLIADLSQTKMLRSSPTGRWPILSLFSIWEKWSPTDCRPVPDQNVEMISDWSPTYLKGQLKRWDKLTSITRFWSPENSFEGIFEKFDFVFEIWAIEILVFTDSEGFRERTGKCAFDTASHKQRSRDVRDDLWVPSQVRFINDSELCSVPVDRWNSSNLTWIWLYWTRTVPKKISWMINRHICYEYGAKWCMFELTNATMIDLTQTSTNIPQMIIPRWITKTK